MEEARARPVNDAQVATFWHLSRQMIPPLMQFCIAPVAGEHRAGWEPSAPSPCVRGTWRRKDRQEFKLNEVGQSNDVVAGPQKAASGAPVLAMPHRTHRRSARIARDEGGRIRSMVIGVHSNGGALFPFILLRLDNPVLIELRGKKIGSNDCGRFPTIRGISVWSNSSLNVSELSAVPSLATQIASKFPSRSPSMSMLKPSSTVLKRAWWDSKEYSLFRESWKRGKSCCSRVVAYEPRNPPAASSIWTSSQSSSGSGIAGFPARD
jgi:hypothetical protein